MSLNYYGIENSHQNMNTINQSSGLLTAQPSQAQHQHQHQQRSDFTLRNSFPSYTRVHNNNSNNNNHILEQVVAANGIHNNVFNSAASGFQMPTVSSDVVSSPIASATTQFQLMPHLMNSFI